MCLTWLSSIPGSERAPGEGNGNPLQYSCLENSMDRGAWWEPLVAQRSPWGRRGHRVRHNWSDWVQHVGIPSFKLIWLFWDFFFFFFPSLKNDRKSTGPELDLSCRTWSVSNWSWAQCFPASVLSDVKWEVEQLSLIGLASQWGPV